VERSKPRHRGAARLTARDLDLLGFIAEHRLVLGTHIQGLLNVSEDAASTRLRALIATGFLSQQPVFYRQPPCYQISRKGLDVIGSALPTPRLDLRGYEHDVGLAWLWLAARSGTFGPLRQTLGERRLRSHDAARDRRADQPFGVRLGGLGPGGHERLHYPDLLLITANGQRVALELELTPKGRARREKILDGYAADNRVDAVVYLVEKPQLARSIADSARQLGISERVHVQWVRSTTQLPGRGPTAVTERLRPGSRSRVTQGAPAEITR
jgi:hypothetical protein